MTAANAPTLQCVRGSHSALKNTNRYVLTFTAVFAMNSVVHPKLVSQARPTSAKEGKGPVNCIYKPCPTVRYNHIAVFCHMTHYVTVCVAMAVLKTAKESFSATAEAVKTLQLYLSGSMLTPQQVIQEWLPHPANRIPVGQSSLLLRKWVGLARLTRKFVFACSSQVPTHIVQQNAVQLRGPERTSDPVHRRLSAFLPCYECTKHWQLESYTHRLILNHVGKCPGPHASGTEPKPKPDGALYMELHR